jgi:outer membrane protein OmpA-like peptidoglycan-associated protein
LLNPTKESFADWNDPALQAIVGKGKAKGGGDARVIPNSGLSAQSIKVGPTSGQSIQDANLIKLRITQGYQPKIPLVRGIYATALQFLDNKSDTFYTALLADERIPVVSYVTLHMQSDAIEPESPVSSPGPGNNGTPTDPNPPAPPEPKPIPGNPPQSPVDPGGKPRPPLPCPNGNTLIEDALADVLFDFDKATLSDAGKQTLDAVIEQGKRQNFESLAITGYTDPLGSAAYNDKLSLDRAKAARDYLVSHGFPDKSIDVVGKGSKDPKITLADCPSGPDQISCLAPDRRVVFTFTKVK